MPFTRHPSANFNDRPEGTDIDCLVIHYTGMRTGTEALERLCDTQASVSAHYLIEEDGRIFSLVSEHKRAWHAGISHWQGDDNMNHNSIGIELVHPGHEFGYRPFAKRQMAALIEILNDIKCRHVIPGDRYVGHSDIAPGRKDDPGELFPWRYLAEEGFGLVCDRQFSENRGVAIAPGQVSGDVKEARRWLHQIGYGVDKLGNCFDDRLKAAVTAFQRHWRQDSVNGVLDGETLLCLENMAQQVAPLRAARAEREK